MLKFINHLFEFKWFPAILRIFTLIIFFALIIMGLSANTGNMAFAKILRNTNLANLIVWSYWWPLIIVSAVFFGRVWCMVCPMELITSLASKIGLKRKPPAFIRSGWVITLFYILILFVGIHVLAIHRVPFRMAVYMMILFAAALISGLVFSRNTFCAHICPVGHLLGLYSKIAPFGWGVKDESICLACKDKSCIADKNAYNFQGRSCGVGLYPAKIKDSSACILCGQCIKACKYNNTGISGRPNPGLMKRAWFEDLFSLKPLTYAQTFFVLIVSGFVYYELFTEWSVSGDLLLYIPHKLQTLTGISGLWAGNLFKSFILFFLFPLVLWMLPYFIFKFSGGDLTVKDYLNNFGLAFIPIAASAHLSKAFIKMTSRIPYWVNALKDPTGIKTATALFEKKQHLNALPVWREPLITFLSLSFMSIGLILSIILVKKLNDKLLKDTGWVKNLMYIAPVTSGLLFLTMMFSWRILF